MKGDPNAYRMPQQGGFMDRAQRVVAPAKKQGGFMNRAMKMSPQGPMARLSAQQPVQGVQTQVTNHTPAATMAAAHRAQLQAAQQAKAMGMQAPLTAAQQAQAMGMQAPRQLPMAQAGGPSLYPGNPRRGGAGRQALASALARRFGAY